MKNIKKAQDYSKKLLDGLVISGALCFTLDEIVVLFFEEIPNESIFRTDFNNKNSIVYKHYNKGKIQAQFNIGSMLFTEMRSGSLEHLEKFIAWKTSRTNNINDDILDY